MLKIFYGSNTDEVRHRAKDEVNKALTASRISAVIDADSYTDGILRDLAGASSLFGEDQVVLLDMLSEVGEAFEELRESSLLLSESTNIFIVIEGKLLATDKKLFSKHAESIVEYGKDMEKEWGTFALADALLRKDKKELWTLLQKSKEKSSFEEIIGTLMWQLKTVRLAHKTKTPEESGLKPFVYKKAKSGAISVEEAEEFSRELLSIYHETHLGKLDGEVALEKFALGFKS